MTKIKVKTFFMVLLLVVVCFIFQKPLTAYAADISWSYDSSTYTLTISGSGDMPDYGKARAERPPWQSVMGKIKYINIDNGITYIGNYSFSSADQVTSIVLPNTVKGVGNYAFYMCDGLTSLTLSNSLKSIGDYAFYMCDGLTELDFPDSLEYIGINTFYQCKNLTSIDMSDSIIEIGQGAFYNCVNLETPDLPSGLEILGEKCFALCQNMVYFTIPEGCKEVGADAISSSNMDRILVLSRDEDLSYYFCRNAGTTRIFGYKNSTAESYCKNAKNSFFRVNPDPPTNVTAVCNTAESIKLTWTGTPYISCYCVQKYVDGEWETIGAPTGCEFIDEDEFIPGETYYYRVAAFSEVLDMWGFHSTFVETSGSVNLSDPVNVVAVCTGPESIEISWDFVPDVDGYAVYRWNGESWQFVKTIMDPDVSYTDTKLAYKNTYYYCVISWKQVKGKLYTSPGASSITGKTNWKIKSPENMKAVCTGPKKIKLSWDSVSDVDGYKIYRKSGDSWTCIKTLSSSATSYTNSGLKYKETYKYRVKGYVKVGDNTYVGDSYASASAKTIIKAPTLNSLKTSRSRAILSWSKVDNASGYYIYEKKGSGGTYKKIATVKGGEVTSYTTGTRKVDQKYYYKVKAYNGDYTSSYSNEKSVKIQKKCLTCKGSGYCKMCAGDGKCKYCFGSKTESCADCFGSGKCISCMGSGKNFDGSKCHFCSNGKCRTCSGRGTTKCVGCSGTGRCVNCSGNGRCPECNGKGK